jgi:16S rRNA (guanine527-N7)-methyltransferase
MTGTVKEEFVKALFRHQAEFGLDLPVDTVERLADYFALVLEHNPLLHLVGPCPPEEFATRHILESLVLLQHLPHSGGLADVGTGAGLPSIPCLLVRDDLKATLIESKVKKAHFLESALKILDLSSRASVVNRQFEETTAGYNNVITCRALDKFDEKLPRLVKWSRPRKMLLFGGNRLSERLKRLGLSVRDELLPMSTARFLYAVKTNG